MAYSLSPGYPGNSSSYQCKTTLYDAETIKYDVYALRYIGYLSVASGEGYKFRLICNELCEFFLKKNGKEASLGQFNDAVVTWVDYLVPFNKNTMVQMSLFQCVSSLDKNHGGISLHKILSME